MEKYRQEHSKTVGPVFEELGPLLKDIRNRLNNLTLTPPPKSQERQTKQETESESAAASMRLHTEGSLGRKAGKIAYPVL